MRRRSLLPLTFTLLASCATQTSDSAGPREPASNSNLVELIVIRPSGRFARGDTLSVDLRGDAEAEKVRYYENAAAAGSIPLEVLGPVGEGSMIVTADRLNVRRCRSRGCSVIGYVARGQVVRVHDFVGSWFRYTGSDGVEGYIHSDGLRLPSAYRGGLLRDLRARTADFYKRELAGRSTADGQPIFRSHEVNPRGEMLSFEFYTAVDKGPGLGAVCDAMRRISQFVEGVMARVPGEIFSAFSAGVYVDSDEGPATENMVAGLATGSATFCRNP